MRCGRQRRNTCLSAGELFDARMTFYFKGDVSSGETEQRVGLADLFSADGCKKCEKEQA
jgi:hypothetical protein